MTKRNNNIVALQKNLSELTAGDVIHLTSGKTDNKNAAHVGIIIDIAEEEKPKGQENIVHGFIVLPVKPYPLCQNITGTKSEQHRLFAKKDFAEISDLNFSADMNYVIDLNAKLIQTNGDEHYSLQAQIHNTPLLEALIEKSEKRNRYICPDTNERPVNKGLQFELDRLGAKPARFLQRIEDSQVFISEEKQLRLATHQENQSSELTKSGHVVRCKSDCSQGAKPPKYTAPKQYRSAATQADISIQEAYELNYLTKQTYQRLSDTFTYLSEAARFIAQSSPEEVDAFCTKTYHRKLTDHWKSVQAHDQPKTEIPKAQQSFFSEYLNGAYQEKRAKLGTQQHQDIIAEDAPTAH